MANLVDREGCFCLKKIGERTGECWWTDLVEVVFTVSHPVVFTPLVHRFFGLHIFCTKQALS